jgi:hypothetical protein
MDQVPIKKVCINISEIYQYQSIGSKFKRHCFGDVCTQIMRADAGVLMGVLTFIYNILMDRMG